MVCYESDSIVYENNKNKTISKISYFVFLPALKVRCTSLRRNTYSQGPITGPQTGSVLISIVYINIPVHYFCVSRSFCECHTKTFVKLLISDLISCLTVCKKEEKHSSALMLVH